MEYGAYHSQEEKESIGSAKKFIWVFLYDVTNFLVNPIEAQSAFHLSLLENIRNPQFKIRIILNFIIISMCYSDFTLTLNTNLKRYRGTSWPIFG